MYKGRNFRTVNVIEIVGRSMSLLKKDKEYFKRFLKELNMKEFVALIEAISEFGLEMQQITLKAGSLKSKEIDDINL